MLGLPVPTQRPSGNSLGDMVCSANLGLWTEAIAGNTHLLHAVCTAIPAYPVHSALLDHVVIHIQTLFSLPLAITESSLCGLL